MLRCLTKLSELRIYGCGKIAGLGVVEQLKEEETDEALLLLPPQLQKLHIWNCPEVSLRADSPYGGNGGGLQALSSLHSLIISVCPKFLACYLSSPSSSCFPFPTALQFLRLDGVEKLAPLSNLASLVELQIRDCGGSEGAGLRRLLAHGCLRELFVFRTPNLFSTECCSEGTLEPSSPSSKLQSLQTDDVAGALAAPICTLLSSSLTSLYLEPNEEMECFTKEQDEALQLLTSLQQLSLCSLPTGL